MTPVGHSLAGLTLLAAVSPPIRGTGKLTAAAVAFVVLANAPDVPLPGWGHDRYDISHSLFTTACGVSLLSILCLALARLPRIGRLPHRMILGGGLAWFSHLLLDSLYNHGLGIAVMWPFGEGRLNFSLPWFDTLRMPIDYTTAHSLGVFRVEALFYGTLLVAVCLLRWGIRSSRKSG